MNYDVNQLLEFLTQNENEEKKDNSINQLNDCNNILKNIINNSQTEVQVFLEMKKIKEYQEIVDETIRGMAKNIVMGKERKYSSLNFLIDLEEAYSKLYYCLIFNTLNYQKEIANMNLSSKESQSEMLELRKRINEVFQEEMVFLKDLKSKYFTYNSLEKKYDYQNQMLIKTLKEEEQLVFRALICLIQINKKIIEKLLIDIQEKLYKMGIESEKLLLQLNRINEKKRKKLEDENNTGKGSKPSK